MPLARRTSAFMSSPACETAASPAACPNSSDRSWRAAFNFPTTSSGNPYISPFLKSRRGAPLSSRETGQGAVENALKSATATERKRASGAFSCRIGKKSELAREGYCATYASRAALFMTKLSCMSLSSSTPTRARSALRSGSLSTRSPNAGTLPLGEAMRTRSLWFARYA
ncbi:hypothetical protein D9M71_694440 [compost metagenome]